MKAVNLFFFTITLHAICLSNTFAQTISYLIDLNEELEWTFISAITDPYINKADTLWVNGDTTIDINKLFVDNIPTSIRKNRITIPDKFNCLNRIRSGSKACNEYESAFKTIELIKNWLELNVGDRHGKYFTNWSKKDIKFINEFLQNPNKSIIDNFVKDTSPLPNIQLSLVNDWLWVQKLSLYFYDPSHIQNIIINYELDMDPNSDLWIESALLPIMRFSNYMLLMGKSRSTISIPERLSDLNKDKTYISLFNYSALLYCLKKYYPHLLGEQDSIEHRITHFPDTFVLASYNIPELNYVLTLYRKSNIFLNLDFIVLNQYLSETNIRDNIHLPVIVFEFWGTWCKPCLENMPLITSLAEKYQGKIQFIAIARDKKEGWLKYINSHNSNPIIHLLAENGTYQFYSPGVNIFPTYIVSNASGKLLSDPINYIEELPNIIKSQYAIE